MNEGTEWMSVSYDWRKAFLLGSKGRLLVLDFDEGGVVKDCDRPQVADTSLIDEWLADVPSRGPSFEWFVAGNNLANQVVQSMNIDPSVPCEASFTRVERAEIKYLVAHGEAGVSDLVPGDGIRVRLDQGGRVSTFAGSSSISFDYEVPSMLRKDFEATNSSILVSNSQAVALGLADAERRYRILVFRRSDKTWHPLPVPSERFPMIRGFGEFMAVTEKRAKSPKNPETAGRSEWRKGRSKMGPVIEGRFHADENVYPGRLYLYDVVNDRVHKIVTNQGDSEVLLVESGTVYYRVTDRLYAAPITDAGVGNARLLATAEAVRDAHWAFIRH
jgi:hypothetical protein